MARVFLPVNDRRRAAADWLCQSLSPTLQRSESEAEVAGHHQAKGHLVCRLHDRAARGIAHQFVHPTPLLSAMIAGPLDTGQDLIDGGAVYNTSGVALVSISWLFWAGNIYLNHKSGN